MIFFKLENRLYQYRKKLDFTFEDLVNLNIDKNDLIKDKLYISANKNIIQNVLVELK